MTDKDQGLLRKALDLASRGRGLAAPNPVVGAIVVDASGDERGNGFYTWEDATHAEVLALEQAGESARGGTLYVSLEPCCFEGRTPACTEAIVKAGVGRVVAATEDPHPKVQGRGFETLEKASIEVVRAADSAPELAAEARLQNEAAFHFSRTGKPMVTLKSAVTLDGKIAAPDDNRGWITSDVARNHVQQVRHDHEAILTGIGTVLADDCLLTDRTGLPRRRPLLRIVADSLARLPLNSKLVESFDDDLVVMTTSAAAVKRKDALEAHGIPVHVLDGERGRVNLAGIVEWLGREQRTSLLFEAGSKLNWAALDAGIVDKILLYYAPKILGGVDSIPMAGGVGRRSRLGALQFRDLRTFSVGPDEFAVEAYPDRSADPPEEAG